MPAPRVRGGEIVFSVDDPQHELDGVRLDTGAEFRRRGHRWTLRLPVPQVDRLEYLLELGGQLVPDPGNPLRAAGPFGEKSVVELPGYAPPVWLDDADAPAGTLVELDIRRGLGGLVWTPENTDPEQPLPLLVVHDGPEYAEYSDLLRFLATAVADAWLPPLRAVLLPPPGDRNQSYSASARYARALTLEVLPALPLPERSLRVAMGASLGALAAFHAHRLYPEGFGALFLQSGSFFSRRDLHESRFVRYGRITRFVDAVLAGRLPAEPVPVTMTCGTLEQNLPANRTLAAALAAQGYDVSLHEVRDAHNWTAWRDAFDPHLLDLLGRVWP